MIRIVRTIKDRLQGKAPKGARRSKHWERVRKEYLKTHTYCEVCGSIKKIEVHHIQPFHVKPELELEPQNLITLCELKKNGLNCHLAFGHAGSYRSHNKDVIADARYWNVKIKTRP